MSYAAVAAHNAPPLSEQPRPNPALLNTEPPSHSAVADDAAKVNLVAPDFKTNPATVTSVKRVPIEPTPVPISGGIPSHAGRDIGPPHKPKPQSATDKAKKYTHDVEKESLPLWSVAKHHLLRPGVAGGLLGVVNVGLLTVASYSLYSKPHLRQDARFLTSTVVTAFTLLSAEGYAAEKYRSTPAGKEEERIARKEGAALYRAARENILRPGVLGGILGMLNIAIIGTIGYYGHKSWDSRWDRRVVSAVSVALLGLWAGEGYLAEQYRQKHH